MTKIDTILREFRSHIVRIRDFASRTAILYPVLHVLAFLLPMVALYLLDPQSFEYTWKGRTYYLFFLFIIVLEVIFASPFTEKSKQTSSSLVRNSSFVIVLLAPILYTVAAQYWGINTWIFTWAVQNQVYFPHWMPLSVEYLVFALLYLFLLLRIYGMAGLRDYALSGIFLLMIGLVYLVDNLYPYGQFTLFQALVPTTVTLAEKILNALHYQTLLIPPYDGGTIHLMAWNASGRAVLGVAWPCAGIDSLILYSITITLFLKKTDIPWRQKVGYFLVGAVVTYLINVLRVVTIFQIAVNGGDYVRFHDYYGPLYSSVWIISYLLLIVGSRLLWRRWRIP